MNKNHKENIKVSFYDFRMAKVVLDLISIAQVTKGRKMVLSSKREE